MFSHSYIFTLHILFVFRLHEISLQANSLSIKQISEDDLLEMIRTRPEGKAADIKPTRARSNVKKISNKLESDKSLSPDKVKTSLDSAKEIKTPPSSPVKTKTSSPVSSKTQMVDLDINLTYVHI